MTFKIETIIILLVFITGLVGTWVTMSIQSKNNVKAIADIKKEQVRSATEFRAYVQESEKRFNVYMASVDTKIATQITQLDKRFDSLEDSLDELKNLRTIDTVRSESTRSDPWSSRMMEAHDNTWLTVLQKYHPELVHEDTPDVLEIQRKYIDVLR